MSLSAESSKTVGLTSKTFLLLHRKLRNRDATKFHIQLCIALFCMLIVFVTGINRASVYGGCVFVSAMIHYLHAGCCNVDGGRGCAHVPEVGPRVSSYHYQIRYCCVTHLLV